MENKTITVRSMEAKIRARDVLCVSAASILGYLGADDETAVKAALDLAVTIFKESAKRINVRDEQPPAEVQPAAAKIVIPAAGAGGVQ